MTVYLMTGSDENYYDKIYPYLETLNKYSPFKNILLTVGFHRSTELDNVYSYYIPKDALTDITTNPCVQAGEFLKYCKFLNDDDIIIFTDGDIRLQREFTPEEIKMVESVKHLDVLAGPNATHSMNTLWNEAEGLRRHCSDDELRKLFSTYHVNLICSTLNMGVLICTAFTYRRINEETYKIFKEFPNITNHMARQQWYMNVAIWSFCYVNMLPYEFHSHPHNGDQPGMKFDPDGTMYVYGDRKVLFRHKYGI